MSRSSHALLLALSCSACSGVVIEPGHRGLVFDPKGGGLQHEIIAPGIYRGPGRIDDFDVTYSTRSEPLHVITSEALSLDVRLSIIYRPIVAELFELDSQIGPAYYEEVVGPEFRAAARAMFARHSFVDLTKDSEKLEDEIESDLRRRIAGKHIEVASVTFESVSLPPDLANAIRERQLAAQIAEKQRIEIESAAQREKLESEHAWEKEKLELERNVIRRRLEREAQGSH